MINYKALHLTDIVLPIRRGARLANLVKVYKDQKIAEKYSKVSWCNLSL